jgi:chemotaxis protein MotB
MSSGSETPPPIIVIRRKKGDHAHHGGAWKVAYADFVTAMMALFIVLWLMNSTEKIRKAISAYFQDPSGSGHQTGSATAGTGESMPISRDNMVNLKERLEQALKKSPDFEKLKDYVQMSVTGEGLRIELLESETGTFFESGSATPSAAARELIATLAEQLGGLPNDVLIEGHTDSRPFSSRAGYSNWELSTDRANAARRLMETGGLRSGQVVQVRGFADHQLRYLDRPLPGHGSPLGRGRGGRTEFCGEASGSGTLEGLKGRPHSAGNPGASPLGWRSPARSYPQRIPDRVTSPSQRKRLCRPARRSTIPRKDPLPLVLPLVLPPVRPRLLEPAEGSAPPASSGQCLESLGALIGFDLDSEQR